MATYPSPYHWELFALYQESPPPLTPLAFLQHWNVSYPKLAQLADVSII
jgi:hypothetical protein